jgi:hypothetical protein
VFVQLTSKVERVDVSNEREQKLVITFNGQPLEVQTGRLFRATPFAMPQVLNLKTLPTRFSLRSYRGLTTAKRSSTYPKWMTVGWANRPPY